ncbi:MAG: glycosyltransferase family 4 protein [Clostridia bacterium]|nr:glycosyltransferase family 4 protein [Clostridia bacterium]
MKILIFYQYYLPKNLGGVNRFNQLVSKWLEAGVDCTVVCSKRSQFGMKIDSNTEEEFPQGEGYGKLKVRRVMPLGGNKGNFISRMLSYVSFSLFSFLVGLFERKVDVIIASSPPLTTATTGLWLRFLKRKPLVFDVRDLWPKCAIDLGFLSNKLAIRYSYRLERRAYNKASLISVVTPDFVEYMRENGIDDEKIVYIPNFSCDLDEYSVQESLDNKREMGLDGKFVVGYFGNHGHAANLSQLVDVAEYFMKENVNVHFILGGAGYKKNEIIDSAISKGLTNITFMQNLSRSDVLKYVRLCDACVTPLIPNESMKAVYPSKVFTYMACKKPIIHTADGACRKLIDDAHCGIYCKPDLPQNMADSILELMNNPDMMTRMGNNGYNYLVENFHPDDISMRYLNSIKNIVKEN